MAKRRHVDANLMRASCLQRALDKTIFSSALQQQQLGRGRFSGIFLKIHNCHAQTVPWVTPHRQVYLAPERTFPDAMGQCKVFAADATCGNHAGERVHRRPLPRNHHQPAGVLVEAVDNAGARQLCRLRVAGQQTVEKCPAPVSRCRVNHQPCRFVDHQQEFVFENDIERHRFRLERQTLRCRLELDSQPVGSLDTDRWLCANLPIEQHAPATYQLLQVVA